MLNEKLQSIITKSLEASIYCNPEEPGLTSNEIISILENLKYQKGEIGDCITELWKNQVIIYSDNNKLLKLNPDKYFIYFTLGLGLYDSDIEPVQLMDESIRYLINREKAHGKAQSAIEKNVLISNFLDQGFDKQKVILAITLLNCYNLLNITKDGLIKLKEHRFNDWLYTDYQNQTHAKQDHSQVKQVIPLVAEIIKRRSDNRPISKDPLEVFESYLEKLGFSNFKTWWYSTYHEWELLSPSTSPKAYLIISAALCEGMLSFIANIAIEKGLSMEKRIKDKAPNLWKFNDLIDAAFSGVKPVDLPPIFC